MKKMKFNSQLFASHLKDKRMHDKKNRISISLRGACKENGLSPATLSRLERENPPDIETFATACKWMGKPMNLYFNK